MNIHQVLATRPSSEVRPNDYNRELLVNVVKASGHGTQVSHITLEFIGLKGKFYQCLMFDGTGDWGASFGAFAMPGCRLQPYQKALILLSSLDYLISNGHLPHATFEFYLERIELEYSQGVGNLQESYELLKKNSEDYVAARDAGDARLFAFVPFWYIVPKHIAEMSGTNVKRYDE
jgi:hypothetical protein